MSERPLATLYQTLGDAVADILEHPACPPTVFNHLAEITGNIDNDTHGKLREAAHARHLVPHCLSLLSAPDTEADEVQQPALTLEQARDKVTAAVCGLIEHPDVTPGVADWVGEFTGALLRKMNVPADNAPADTDAAVAHQRLDEATQKFIQDRERFVAAVWQRLSPEENEQAWREYSELCARVFQGGRLWSLEWVWILTVVFRLIEEDMAASANESSNGYPTLAVLRRMTEVFGEADDFTSADVDTGRRLAGYLTADAQPYPAQAAAERGSDEQTTV